MASLNPRGAWRRAFERGYVVAWDDLGLAGKLPEKGRMVESLRGFLEKLGRNTVG